MAALLALLSAVTYGAGDFFGGFASRRLRAEAVVLRTHVVGLVALLAVAPLIAADAVRADDLGFGAAGGVLGGIGILFLYRAMVLGSMSVVAPITGVLSAVVPVVGGVVQGERPQVLAWVGVVVGLLAVLLVSLEEPPIEGDGSRPADTRAAVLNALVAGFGFGLFFLLIAGAEEGAGLWPAVAGRGASTVLFALVALLVPAARAGSRVARQGSMPALLVACGVCDAGANALFLLATHRGLLTLVSVLGALYPAVTILLARVVLHERLRRIQLGGVALAGAAVVLVTAA